MTCPRWQSSCGWSKDWNPVFSDYTHCVLSLGQAITHTEELCLLGETWQCLRHFWLSHWGVLLVPIE